VFVVSKLGVDAYDQGAARAAATREFGGQGHRVMVKGSTPDIRALTVRERVLLFCVGSDTDWQRAGVTSEIVTALATFRRKNSRLSALVPMTVWPGRCEGERVRA